MEESEKRKEKLKAIREEAAEAGDNSEVQKSIREPLGDGLTNPLIESPSASQPCNTPRPRSMNAGSPAYHVQGNYNSAKKTYQPRGVNAIPLGIRRKTSPICTPPGNSSNTLDSSLGTPNNYSPPNSPQIGDISSDCFPQGGGDGSQYGQGSPYQGSGFRGSRHQGSGRSKGLLKVYYHESMVQDPWKVLKPVIWKPCGDTRDSPNSWLPKSNLSKKAKLGETPTKSTPQQSLAEYLAAAFTEAAGKDTVNDESGT